jgi:hypothetical protein
MDDMGSGSKQSEGKLYPAGRQVPGNGYYLVAEACNLDQAPLMICFYNNGLRNEGKFLLRLQRCHRDEKYR